MRTRVEPCPLQCEVTAPEWGDIYTIGVNGTLYSENFRRRIGPATIWRRRCPVCNGRGMIHVVLEHVA